MKFHQNFDKVLFTTNKTLSKRPEIYSLYRLIFSRISSNPKL